MQRSYTFSSRPQRKDASQQSKVHRGPTRSKRSHSTATPPPLPPPRISPPSSLSGLVPVSEPLPSPVHTSPPDPFSASKPLTRRPSSVKASMRLNLTVNKLKPPSGQAVQLSNFVSTYPNCLPLCIQVQNGFCSSTSDLSISQNEHLNLHFIKHTKVITLRDCKEGKNTFSVPLNSAVDFALLYDPYRDEEQALQGYCFETVAELMALKSLPRVVRATKSYEGRTLETSVRADELLIVKGIRSGSFPGRTKTLEVYSMQYGKKFLSEKCMAFFSTRPSEVRITISTMSRFGLSFPQKVIILGDCEIMSRLPPCMTSTPVVLEGYRGETSVIATMANRDPSLHGKVSSFELFSDLDLQFQALTLAQGEQEQLSEMTSMLYRSFSASTHPMFMEKPTSRAYELQVLLYRKVTKPCQNDGIQLVWPLLLDEDTPKSDASDIVFSDMEVASSTSRESGAQTRSWQEGGRAVELPFPYRHSLSPLSLAPPNQVEKKVTDNESTNEAVYQVIGMTRQEMKENEYIHEDEHREAVTDTTAVASVSQSQCNGDHGSPQLQDYDTLWGHVAHVTKRLNELTARVDKMANSIESLSRNASRTSFPNGIASTWQEIQEQFRELESSMQSSAHQPETQEQSRAAAAAEGSHKMEPLCAENRETLAAMDCNQIQRLLEAMNLCQYKESFRREQVDGLILLDCDEDILENELHVSSRIHRLRFTKLISGRVSAQDILNNAQYVVFTH